MKKLLVALLASLSLCFCFLFAGCAENGTYKLVNIKYTSEDTTLTCMVGDKFEGMTLQEDTYMLIVKGDDVIFRSHYVEEEDGIIDESTNILVGKWIKGYEDEVYFYTESDSDAMVVKKNGKTIVIKYRYNMEITLSK